MSSSYDFSSDGFTTSAGVPRKKSDMSTKEWNRKLAFRCRRIKDIYTRQSTNLTGEHTLVIRSVYHQGEAATVHPFGEMTSAYGVMEYIVY